MPLRTRTVVASVTDCSGEANKHGLSPAEVPSLAPALAGLRHVRVVGLMTMAALGEIAEDARPSFARLRALRDQMRERTGLALPHLSMGMSHDFEAAIEEGATLVRVGSALFEGVVP